ncbi:sodium:proton antiporter [Aurantimonas sp. VKM B-3413]|uniref:cation:proton antiporter n=1 Tax=Aurantimonas sp. VKM B-3413 TaxID=2779401 RepID=UPI001E5097F7|nr:sodium:proton antiporter [Aurantimonas sp. VKM B-3413]MCB8839349.1 sodium:proton antiporter [Aurantimonas sp. VKM B-3413]
MDLNAALLIAGGAVLVLGILSGYVKNRLWITETALCLLVGVIIGPAVLNFVDMSDTPGDRFVVMQEVARLTLGLAVMGAALRLPAGFEIARWRDMALALGGGMLVMWLAGAGLAIGILGFSLLPALLLGAILAPTDPVLAGSIVSGQSAVNSVPTRVRNILSAESGGNDGLGMLFVMLPLLLLTKDSHDAWLEWATRVLFWEIIFAVVIGALIGWLAGRLLIWAYEQPYSETQSTVTVGLSLSITVLAAVKLMGSDGILAVFAAGLVFNRFISERETRQGHAQEAMGRFFDLPVFILFGVMLPWGEWYQLGWPGLAFAIALIFLRRPPFWLFLARPMTCVRGWAETAFVGWFGPMGVASIYYAIMAMHETGRHEFWPIATLAVAVSATVHGVTATPLSHWLGRHKQAENAAGHPSPAKAERASDSSDDTRQRARQDV